MEPALRDPDFHTYGEYLTWPEDVRYELIDGRAYLMAPAPTLDHQDITGEIYFQLRQALEDKPCRPFIAPVDVRLPKQDETDDAIDTVVQPDVLVVCDETKLDRRGVRGAPDLVVEVSTPATAYHDHQRKRAIYERAGVSEYWLVDPIERMITVYHLESGRYGKPEIHPMRGETPVKILPEAFIRWDPLLQRLPESDG
ncbi:MAG: Uma2 family endonuclease [Methylothermaceae bacterium]|nr:Uma2 family endonuclease [Methylothermaceae bacterium]